MLIRWSIWGPSVSADLELLGVSVASFRKHFGNDARYLVSTDSPGAVAARVGRGVEVCAYSAFANPLFHVFDETPWAKWCPSARLEPGETEMLVDSDVFLLARPTEIFAALAAPRRYDYCALREYLGARSQRGRFAARVPAFMPFINAGFFVQAPAADISQALLAEFDWWRATVAPDKATFHDEQGALTAALAGPLRAGRVFLLPKDRYRIVSPRSNKRLRSLRGTVLMHATWPAHPAYHQFKPYISRVTRPAARQGS